MVIHLKSLGPKTLNRKSLLELQKQHMLTGPEGLLSVIQFTPCDSIF